VLGVHVVGAVDEPELAATFRASVVDRERARRFCLPLVEAMSFGKPVVARGAAVPETVGKRRDARAA
jgi:glycosyltransferase involved in cell wall biosynthesis